MPNDDKELIHSLFAERDRLKIAYADARNELDRLGKEIKLLSMDAIADKFESKTDTIRHYYLAYHRKYAGNRPNNKHA